MKISIITVSYNSGATIRDTIESVLSQTFPNVEYIVVDGGSKDATLSVIREYNNQIAKVTTEPDEGMYDAMNKGISKSTGDIIGFLHSDDVFENRSVLTGIAQAFTERDIDAVYGDLLYVERGNEDRIVRYWRAGKNHGIERWRWGWMPPHPTFYAKRKLYREYGLYRKELGTAADYELMLRFAVKRRIVLEYIPKILVRMRTGGKSNISLRNRILANRIDREAWRVNELHAHPLMPLFKPLRKIPQYFSKRTS